MGQITTEDIEELYQDAKRLDMIVEDKTKLDEFLNISEKDNITTKIYNLEQEKNLLLAKTFLIMASTCENIGVYQNEVFLYGDSMRLLAKVYIKNDKVEGIINKDGSHNIGSGYHFKTSDKGLAEEFESTFMYKAKLEQEERLLAEIKGLYNKIKK